MLMLDQWEQTGVFNPTDPTQKKIESYSGVPGAYATYYFNRVPTTGQLRGPFTESIGRGAGLLTGAFIASIAIGAALYGLRKTGVLKMKLRKGGVSGLGRRRRRR